jgi:hypothetical protein
MNNIHVLPTDKSSRLYSYKGVLNLAISEFVASAIVKNDLINLNIYITSDEEIKDDWCYDEYNKVVFKNTGAGTPEASKKIILTTDPSLDGVQAIDDEFLEWFVKNPNCEEVEIKTRYLHSYKTGENFISFSKTPEFSSRNMQCIKIEPRYEIIIPQEEPKQMSKQTAVEWLVDKIINKQNGTFDGFPVLSLDEIFEQAKEMEKEQIKEAYMSALPFNLDYSDYDKYSNKYYNETYKKNQ